MDTDPGFQAALSEAKEGLAASGIPIGALSSRRWANPRPQT
jgi:hypothetical protein